MPTVVGVWLRAWACGRGAGKRRIAEKNEAEKIGNGEEAGGRGRGAHDCVDARVPLQQRGAGGSPKPHDESKVILQQSELPHKNSRLSHAI